MIFINHECKLVLMFIPRFLPLPPTGTPLLKQRWTCLLLSLSIIKLHSLDFHMGKVNHRHSTWYLCCWPLISHNELRISVRMYANNAMWNGVGICINKCLQRNWCWNWEHVILLSTSKLTFDMFCYYLLFNTLMFNVVCR